jgi:N-acetylglutamate synthase-like GNAT family acetyltransferase
MHERMTHHTSTPHTVTLLGGEDLRQLGILDVHAQQVTSHLAKGEGGTLPVPVDTLLDLAYCSIYAIMASPEESTIGSLRSNNDGYTDWKLAGHVAVYPDTAEVPKGATTRFLLRSLVITPDYRGQGIAGRLIEGAVALATKLANLSDDPVSNKPTTYLLTRTTSPDLFLKYGFELAPDDIGKLYPATDSNPTKSVLCKRIGVVAQSPI